MAMTVSAMNDLSIEDLRALLEAKQTEQTETIRKMASDFVGDEALDSNQREVTDAAWEAMSCLEPLTHEQIVEINRVGANIIRRVDEDGVVSHAPSTARVFLARVNKEDATNLAMVVRVYHTSADSVDCVEPTDFTLAQWEKLVPAAQLINRESPSAEQYVFALTRNGKMLDEASGEILDFEPVKYARTFVFEMDLGDGKQGYRFLMPFNVAQLTTSRFKANSAESITWHRAGIKAEAANGLTEPVLARFQAIANLIGEVRGAYIADQIVKGTFRFSSIRSSAKRQTALGKVVYALHISNKLSYTQRVALAEKCLASTQALVEYRAANAAKPNDDAPLTDEVPF